MLLRASWIDSSWFVASLPLNWAAADSSSSEAILLMAAGTDSSDLRRYAMQRSPPTGGPAASYDSGFVACCAARPTTAASTGFAWFLSAGAAPVFQQPFLAVDTFPAVAWFFRRVSSVEQHPACLYGVGQIDRQHLIPNAGDHFRILHRKEHFDAMVDVPGHEVRTADVDFLRRRRSGNSTRGCARGNARRRWSPRCFRSRQARRDGGSRSRAPEALLSPRPATRDIGRGSSACRTRAFILNIRCPPLPLFACSISRAISSSKRERRLTGATISFR